MKKLTPHIPPMRWAGRSRVSESGFAAIAIKPSVHAYSATRNFARSSGKASRRAGTPPAARACNSTCANRDSVAARTGSPGSCGRAVCGRGQNAAFRPCEPARRTRSLNTGWPKCRHRIVRAKFASALRRCPSGTGSALWPSRSARLAMRRHLFRNSGKAGSN